MPYRLLQPATVYPFSVSGPLPNGKSACDDLTPVRLLVAGWLKLGDAAKVPVAVTRKLHMERTPQGESTCAVHWVLSGQFSTDDASFANFDILTDLGSHVLGGLNLTETERRATINYAGPHGPESAVLCHEQEA
jgi:hypothetical protein